MAIETYIANHPLTQSLHSNPTFKEIRANATIPEALRPRTLTSGTLAGPGRITVPPFLFYDPEGEGKDFISIFHLGEDVCGHPGIVHGGLLATLLDEGLGRCCFPAMPHGVAVTANLNLDYRRPAFTGSYFVLRAWTVKVEGRKAWVEGRIESLPSSPSGNDDEEKVEEEEPVVFVEAKALFIEPKQAKVSLLFLSILPPLAGMTHSANNDVFFSCQMMSSLYKPPT